MNNKLEQLYEANFTSKTVKMNAKKLTFNFTATPIPDHSYYTFNFTEASDWYTGFEVAGADIEKQVEDVLKDIAGASVQSYTANGFNANENGTIITAVFTRAARLEKVRLYIDSNSIDIRMNEERTVELLNQLNKYAQEKPYNWTSHVSNIVSYVKNLQAVRSALTQNTSAHGIDLGDF